MRPLTVARLLLGAVGLPLSRRTDLVGAAVDSPR
jgi:hypothetical protein